MCFVCVPWFGLCLCPSVSDALVEGYCLGIGAFLFPIVLNVIAIMSISLKKLNTIPLIVSE
jgi:hypothetical protein